MIYDENGVIVNAENMEEFPELLTSEMVEECTRALQTSIPTFRVKWREGEEYETFSRVRYTHFEKMYQRYEVLDRLQERIADHLSTTTYRTDIRIYKGRSGSNHLVPKTTHNLLIFWGDQRGITVDSKSIRSPCAVYVEKGRDKAVTVCSSSDEDNTLYEIRCAIDPPFSRNRDHSENLPNIVPPFQGQHVDFATRELLRTALMHIIDAELSVTDLNMWNEMLVEDIRRGFRDDDESDDDESDDDESDE